MNSSNYLGCLCIAVVVMYLLALFKAVYSNGSIRRKFKEYDTTIAPKWDPDEMSKDRYQEIRVKYKL